jgi:uncharacterized protein YodC (DUF2158 family)
MKRTNNLIVPTRLWTCDEQVRAMLAKAALPEGMLLQHARIADSVTKAKDEDGSERRRRFRISTESTDRHGDVVRSRGISLKNYRKNPVVLFAHESRMPPIGKSPKIDIGDGTVDADVDFFARDVYEFADTIFRIVEAGGLKATSIGFIPTKFARLPEPEGESANDGSRMRVGYDFIKSDLLEFSIVPIPANPEAVGRAVKDGATAIKQYADWLEDIQDNYTKSGVLADLGVTVENVFDVYKAAKGDAVSVQVLDTGSESSEEQAPAESPAESESPAEPATEEQQAPAPAVEEAQPEPKALVVRSSPIGDGRIVEVEGEIPKRLLFSKALLEAGALDSERMKREGSVLTLSLDSHTLVYAIQKEGEQEVEADLVSAEPCAPVTYFQAHPEKGQASQPKDASWNVSQEVASVLATGPVLRSMGAWQKDAAVSFVHHKGTEPHAVNYRACVGGIAILLGAQGDWNKVPDADRKGVFAHLAEHLRDDFNTTPPAVKWLDEQPLAQDAYFFDYDGARLLSKTADGFVVADAEEPAPMKVRTVLGRRIAWPSRDKFLAWAKEAGYSTDALTETRAFWRLAQEKGEGEPEAVISLMPNDVAPSSDDCKVQLELSPPVQIEQKAAPIVEVGELKVGDVVVLRSGGPAMTVASFKRCKDAPPLVECNWFADGSELEQGAFAPGLLKRLDIDDALAEDEPEAEAPLNGDEVKAFIADVVKEVVEQAVAPAVKEAVLAEVRKLQGVVA